MAGMCSHRGVLVVFDGHVCCCCQRQRPEFWSICYGSGDHPSSDRFVSLETRSKFIAMGRRLEF